MTTMKNFRTFDLAVEFQRLASNLEISGTTRSQLKRAATSIALNLAEGRGKVGIDEQKRFFQIAMGSLRECQAVLILEQLEGSPAWKLLDKLGAHLYKLLQFAR